MTVTLVNTEYAPDAELMMDDFTLTTTDVPGVTMVSDVSRVSATEATLTLAYGGEDFTTDGSLSVTVRESGHTGSGELVTNSVQIMAIAPALTLTTPDDQRYPINRAILALTLLEASNATGAATYTLTGPTGESLATAVPGLAFTPADRILSGTPTATGTTTLTYTVTDSATPPATASATFDVAITPETAPTITAIELTSDAVDNVYALDDEIEATVTFSEAVIVTGQPPQLALTVGTQTRQAVYDDSGSTTTTLVFRYTVADNDLDTDGVSIIGPNALTRVGSTIQSEADSEDARLTHTTVAGTAAHTVDGIVPTVSSVAITSTGPYVEDEVIALTATFSEAVTVETVGGTRRYRWSWR